MKTWILLSLAALSAVCAEQDCRRGACYPKMGDLLLGRERSLSASSTCGLTGSEVVCTPHGQWKMKCCSCDSRNPAAYNAHTVRDVISTAGPNRWWQSKKEENPVSLQLDLNGIYHVDTVSLSFKGPRPDALIIERSRDYGRSWQPVLYMATDCPSTFPRVSTSFPRSFEETYCFTLPSTAADPYRDQKVHFYPLRQYSNIDAPNEYKIEVASGFTGLRVNLTRLGSVPSMPGRGLNHFYALREMQVMGSCFCHGHAQRCLHDTSNNYLLNTQVGGVCECQHNTVGVNCERCDDFYNDLPWRPAESGNTHACKSCECNNHSSRCHFDAGRYEATGRRSGGVCDACAHHTTGPNCERCERNYYHNPLSDIRSPDACLRCQCEPAGSESGGQCDPRTGVCVCKANVEGDRCERCKRGFYNLDANNPLGCSKCVCSAVGSVGDECHPVTGQCVCRSNAEGVSCDQCAPGFWNPTSPHGCQPCECYRPNALSNTCDQRTGQCFCRPGIGGRTCSGCPDNTYGDPLIGCRPCNCDRLGTESCDKRTGVCVCKAGVSGARCDACSSGHCSRFPECPACPSCFFRLSGRLQELTHTLQRLENRLISAGGPTDTHHTQRRIHTLLQTLQSIQSSVRDTPASRDAFTRALDTLNQLRSQLDALRVALPPLDGALERELDDLQRLLSSLRLDYFTKAEAFFSASGSSNASSFYAIQNSYDKSTDAVKRANATKDTLKKSEGIRENALSDINNVQPRNTEDLQNLGKDVATSPNLTPTANKVCGDERRDPCTPQRCDGVPCPAGAPPCGAQENCAGALPNANRAAQDAEEVKTKLQQLNDKIKQAAAQIQEADKEANSVRLSTDKLANQIKQAQGEVDKDLKDTKDFIKKLRDFLTDRHSDPEQVQRVCDSVLEAQFPESVEKLKQKLKELQDVMKSVPDSRDALEDSRDALEESRRLLERAEETRDAAFGIQQDADSILKDIGENEGILDELEDKVQDIMEIVNNTRNDIQQIEDALLPAEQGIVGITGLLDEFRPLLEDLKNDVKTATKLADDAQNEADSAQDEADGAAQDLAALKGALERLKRAASENTDAGEDATRLLELQKEAESLMNDTSDITKTLKDKEASIRRGAAEMEENGQKLSGLDTLAEELRDDIRSKVTRLNMCQG